MKLDFALILSLLALATGLIWLLDKCLFEKKRKALAGDVKDPVVVEYAKSLFPVVFLVLGLRSFLAEPFRIPSGSMMPKRLNSTISSPRLNQSAAKCLYFVIQA